MNETFLKFLPLVKLVVKFSQSLSISVFCLYEETQYEHFEVEFFSNELLIFWLRALVVWCSRKLSAKFHRKIMIKSASEIQHSVSTDTFGFPLRRDSHNNRTNTLWISRENPNLNNYFRKQSNVNSHRSNHWRGPAWDGRLFISYDKWSKPSLFNFSLCRPSLITLFW